jgi:hypothetical protein
MRSFDRGIAFFCLISFFAGALKLSGFFNRYCVPFDLAGDFFGELWRFFKDIDFDAGFLIAEADC